ncbi:hypothetical protein ANN_05156 [Periplaneta americana]|uniref:DUF4817 domain-containing protein n=1 Tax=Periplaneta americana TaxID=6978 RepID=A0ABQ8TAF9_PERAM|nr:hypothetical protein ANN_05156 [Periplaneta americana]
MQSKDKYRNVTEAGNPILSQKNKACECLNLKEFIAVVALNFDRKQVRHPIARLLTWLFNDAVSTTRLFSVDEFGDSEMVFGEMRSRIRHRLSGIHISVEENLGKNPTRSLPSKETLRGHSDSSFRGEGYIQCCVGVRLCDMYSNQELAEIHFMYGKADGNAALARRLYQERYPQRQCPVRKTFVRLHYRLCEYGKFNSPGLGRGRPRSTTPEVPTGGDSGGCEHDSFYQHTKGSVASQCSSYDCLETVERVGINCILIICNVYRPCHQQITLHELGSVSGSCSSVV